MEPITILILIGIVLLGLIAYNQYQINQLKNDIKVLELQIYVLAGATANKIIELEEKNKKDE